MTSHSAPNKHIVQRTEIGVREGTKEVLGAETYFYRRI